MLFVNFICLFVCSCANSLKYIGITMKNMHVVGVYCCMFSIENKMCSPYLFIYGDTQKYIITLWIIRVNTTKYEILIILDIEIVF